MPKLMQYNGSEWVEIGRNGKSAYELWLDAGNNGTQQEFLRSLKGKDADSKTIVKETTTIVREKLGEEVSKRLDTNLESMRRSIKSSKTVSLRELDDVNLTDVTKVDGKYVLGGGSSLPDQTGNNGKFLTTDGTDASWATLAGGGDMAAAVYDPAGGAEQVAFASDLGTAAAANTGDFATAAQGALADSATQPGDLGALAALDTVGTAQIDNDAVTFDKIENIATNRVLARSTAGTGSVEDLTLPNFRTPINVEDGADVTDTANVTAAGALMDSEVTNLAQVKAFDSSDYATAAQGTTADSAVQPNTDVTLTDLEITGEFGADAEVDDGNSSTADTINWTTGNFHKSTMTGNCTYTFTAPTYVGRYQLKLVQDATGSRIATWPAAVKWPGGTAPTLSTAASSIDIITFYWDGTNYFGVDSLAFA